MPSIFEVDQKGLAKLLQRRGIEFILYELFQNAVDAEGVKEVRINLEKLPGRPAATIVVLDDSPGGFKRITDAYVLFAESSKKSDPTLRGRFNLGEKLVIAMCSECELWTATGHFKFNKEGRHRLRGCRGCGTEFTGEFACTHEQFDVIVRAAGRLLIPDNVVVWFNGDRLQPRARAASFTATLSTEIADEEGVLRRTARECRVDLYEPREGEVASIYEMGIPVVETNDKYHVDVQQKVPLSFDRDNVTPAYLRTLRTFTLNAVFDKIDTADANATWARDAACDKRASVEAIKTVADKRFGEKRVSYDPSDPEANKRAVAAGYVVVHGSMGSKEEWENLRNANAILPAGQVTPSDRPYGDGPMEEVIPENEWTGDMRRTAAYAKMLARELMGLGVLGIGIGIKMTRAGTNFMACYGNRQLTFNLNGGCTEKFFANVGSLQMDSLLIHEFGHQYSMDHLSEEYYDALTDLGAKLKRLALDKPELFNDFKPFD